MSDWCFPVGNAECSESCPFLRPSHPPPLPFQTSAPAAQIHLHRTHIIAYTELLKNYRENGNFRRKIAPVGVVFQVLPFSFLSVRVSRAMKYQEVYHEPSHSSCMTDVAYFSRATHHVVIVFSASTSWPLTLPPSCVFVWWSTKTVF